MSESAQSMMPPATADSADHRAAPRYALLLRTAKLIGPTGEYLCVVRDVSATGISVRTFHQLPDDTALTLELPTGDRYPLEKVWEKEGAAGFRFGAEVDVERLIEGKGRFPKRGVRLYLSHPATLSSLGGTFDAVIHNLSQQGARVECHQRLAIDQKIRLECKGLPPIRAVVRWRENKEYGLAFDDTFQFGELARIAALLQGASRSEFVTGEQLRSEIA
jgi:hypothetical protein